MKLYDPRIRKTVESDNPALILRDWLVTAGYDVDDESFKRAADHYDESVVFH